VSEVDSATTELAAINSAIAASMVSPWRSRSSIQSRISFFGGFLFTVPLGLFPVITHLTPLTQHKKQPGTRRPLR
jgi:hypothetical protein